MIHFLTPYYKGDLGKAYNIAAELIPSNDWVCFIDADVMVLNSNFGDILQECIDKFGRQYPLMTCLTNRVAEPSQRLAGHLNENPSALYHKKMADKVAMNPPSVKEAPRPISGMLMLFPKWLWADIGGFKSGILGVDNDFHHKVVSSGRKVGVIQNLYVFHYYRLHKAVNDVTHLNV